MSEPKVHRFITTDELFPEANAGVLYYEKSEADKVIAELKKEKEYVIEHTAEVINAQERELRHQKYKRCLVMAKWCDEVMMSCELRGYAVHRMWANRHQWAMRWKYKWLAIAEKFKPNNSTAK